MVAFVNRSTKDTVIVNRHFESGQPVTGFVSWTLPPK